MEYYILYYTQDTTITFQAFENSEPIITDYIEGQVFQCNGTQIFNINAVSERFKINYMNFDIAIVDQDLHDKVYSLLRDGKQVKLKKIKTKWTYEEILPLKEQRIQEIRLEAINKLDNVEFNITLDGLDIDNKPTKKTFLINGKTRLNLQEKELDLKNGLDAFWGLNSDFRLTLEHFNLIRQKGKDIENQIKEDCRKKIAEINNE